MVVLTEKKLYVALLYILNAAVMNTIFALKRFMWKSLQKHYAIDFLLFSLIIIKI